MDRRDWIKQVTAGSFTALATPLIATNDANAETVKASGPSEVIRTENAKEGAKDWQLTRVRLDKNLGFRTPWIEGYCSKQSVSAGESIEIKVSTDPPQPFQIDHAIRRHRQSGDTHPGKTLSQARGGLVKHLQLHLQKYRLD